MLGFCSWLLYMAAVTRCFTWLLYFMSKTLIQRVCQVFQYYYPVVQELLSPDLDWYTGVAVSYPAAFRSFVS